MRSDDAEARLRALLREAGVRPRRPKAEDVERTWQVMRRFAAEPIEDAQPREEDGDGILAQYGVYDWGDGEHFELDMTRQFIFADESGDYDHMAQLHCSFHFKPSDELRALGEANLWSFGMALGDFFDEALAMPGFAGVRASGARPKRLVVEYGDV